MSELSVTQRQRVQTTPQERSYSSGTSDVPLLGDTIGDNSRPNGHHAARPRGAGGGADRTVLDLHQLAEEVNTLALGLLATGIVKGDWVGIWAPEEGAAGTADRPL
jgi:fatty-acyl-CoA synthase